MNKVCIIIPYFGKWPSYFDLFLKSCSYNSNLTILFFTDLQPPEVYPDNVRFNHFTFSQIRSSLDEILGFKTQLTTSYKLCDVRPSYGLIFKDFISEFDFWGWGDIDLIYGSISHFITDELLSNYDVISCRNRWLSGSFCLIKNNENLNRLFLTSGDLNKIFGSESYMGFDEISRCWDQIKNRSLEEIEWPNDNFTQIVLKATHEQSIKSHFGNFIKESIPAGDHLIWDNGKLSDSHRKEYSHYHFITEKRKAYFQYPNWASVPSKFFISQTGFYTEDEFRRYNLIHLKRTLMAMPDIVSGFVQRGINYIKKISR